jgi:integrase/recombinase XerC
LLAAPDRSTLGGKRDAALLHVLAETGLHRAQLVALNVEHFDRTGNRLRVPPPQSSSYGSNADEQEEQTAKPVWRPLSVTCVDLLGTYLDASGHGQQDPHAPLFRSLDHRFKHRGGRLKQDAVYKLVSEYGRQIKAAVSPRTLRRTAQETLRIGKPEI